MGDYEEYKKYVLLQKSRRLDDSRREEWSTPCEGCDGTGGMPCATCTPKAYNLFPDGCTCPCSTTRRSQFILCDFCKLLSQSSCENCNNGEQNCIYCDGEGNRKVF